MEGSRRRAQERDKKERDRVKGTDKEKQTEIGEDTRRRKRENEGRVGEREKGLVEGEKKGKFKKQREARKRNLFLTFCLIGPGANRHTTKTASAAWNATRLLPWAHMLLSRAKYFASLISNSSLSSRVTTTKVRQPADPAA